MVVYVLSHTWQCDCGDFGTEVKVFETIEKAQSEFRQLRRQAKVDFKDLDTEQDKYVEGDMAWSIWEEGNYAYNHIDLQITESEVL